MDKILLEEAFRALNEEEFNLQSEEEVVDAQKFLMDNNEDSDIINVIIDANARDEEELEDSYVGKIILECNTCKSLFYKDEEEVEINPETNVANEEDICPVCMLTSGYEVIGKVEPFGEYEKEQEEEKHEEEHEEEPKEDKIEDEEKVEVEVEKEDKLEESYTRHTVIEKFKRAKAKKVNEALEDDGLDEETRESLNKVIENFEPVVLDAKFDEEGAYILVGDKNSSYKFWMEVDEDGERIDWNQYIFNLENSLDLEKRYLQDNADLFDKVSSEAYNYFQDNKPVKERLDMRKTSIAEARTRLKRAPKKGLKESSKLDDIDADADDKKEKAKAEFEKTKDDADADRDYKKDKLEESDKPAATSIQDAQKWVDYDMKKYGKISERTNRLVRKAGFQIVKDDHDDYEVIAGKYDESLKEDFQKVDIETDREKMTMTAEENGKVTVTTEPKDVVEEKEEIKDETIAPLSDEEEKAIEEPKEEDNLEEIEFDEFEEKDFDELGESYLKKVYDNVTGFKTTSGKMKDNSIILEGIISFASGKQAKTNFVFRADKVSRDGKVKFLGENLQISKNHSAYVLTASVKDKKVISEKLQYHYFAKDTNNKGKNLYGVVSK